MKKVLVTLPVNEDHKRYLNDCLVKGTDRYELIFTDGADPSDDQLKEAEVLLGIYSAEWAKKAENAKWIQLASAGSDAFVIPGVLKKDTVLTSAVGAYGISVGEHMLAQTFYMIRRMGAYTKAQSEHTWQDMGPNISVNGAVVAVLGMGDIGGYYASKMKALGAYVIGVRKNAHEKPEYLDEQYLISDLDSVLARADIVAMILPGGDETYHIMNEEKLRLMKKGAYILNAGRGNSLDPDGLKKLLKEGLLAGAALDVTEPEPLLKDDELWDMENVLITPHVAGGLHLSSTLERIVGIMGENLKAWISKEKMRNIVKH